MSRVQFRYDVSISPINYLHAAFVVVVFFFLLLLLFFLGGVKEHYHYHSENGLDPDMISVQTAW